MKWAAFLWLASGANTVSCVNGLSDGDPAWSCCLSVALAFITGILGTLALLDLRNERS